MVDFSNIASGALTGGSTGSMFGPAGTAIGAVTGGVLGLFGSKKKKRKPKRSSTFDPQQQELYDQHMQALQGQGPMANLYNFDANAANQNFERNTAQPAYQNFQENVIPNITGQFRNDNLMNSSYTGEALSKAGRDLQKNLDTQRANAMYQGEQTAQNSRRTGVENSLNRATFGYQPSQESSPNIIDQVLNAAGPAAGQWFSDYLSNRSSKGGSSLQGASARPANQGRVGAY